MATALKHKLSYHRRLFLLLLVFSWTLVGCFILFQYGREKHFKAERLDAQLQLFNLRMLDAVNAGAPPDAFIARSGAPCEGVRVTLIDPAGHVVFDNSLDTLPGANHLDRPEVAEALKAGKPVVALESTIISHGMPYPQNVETALKVEQIIRDAGAVPATIAIIGGRLKAGLSKEESDYLGRTGAGIPKASRRDLPVLVAQGKDGACTVTTTMMIADMAGIRVFATGGIGGVHRGAQETFDISADLEELANTSVMVVCAGAKSILDLGLTLEYLETHGVTVIGYGTDELPAFYTRKSGFGVDYELDTPAELAKAFHVKRELGLRGGLLVTNPIPEEYSMDPAVINKAIDEAVAECKAKGVHGKETTPFLLAKVKDLTGGDSLDSNIQLVYNNARLAARTACALQTLEQA